MRPELGISHGFLTFENLGELISTIDDYITFHNRVVERYSDRLGALLRTTGASSEATMQMMAGDDSESDAKKGGPKRKEDDQSWVTLGFDEYAVKVANRPGAAATNEISILFKILETLKAKVVSLENAKKTLVDLPSKGFRADQRFIVLFRDSLPRQIIPTNDSGAKVAKFRYYEQFDLEVLKLDSTVPCRS